MELNINTLIQNSTRMNSKNTRNKKGSLKFTANKKFGSRYYTEVGVERTHFLNKKMLARSILRKLSITVERRAEILQGKKDRESLY